MPVANRALMLLKPLPAQTFPLRDLAKAQQMFMLKRHVGNIVVET